MTENKTPGGTAAAWDSDLYDQKHSFVWKYGESLLELLAPQPGERILDLGCGTGHLTARIAEAGAMALGLDSSPAMIEQARRSYPHLTFEVADARDALPPHEVHHRRGAGVRVHAALHRREPLAHAPVEVVQLRAEGRFVRFRQGRQHPQQHQPAQDIGAVGFGDQSRESLDLAHAVQPGGLLGCRGQGQYQTNRGLSA